MVRNGEKASLKFFWTAPSCVPATTFETSGGIIDGNDIQSLFQNSKIVALGEMMNYPGVILKDEAVLKKCEIARENSRVLDGHAPGVTGNDLKSYVSEGISTDHECSGLEEALEKLRYGMKILIREGSSAKNFEALYPLMESHPDEVMLCSDDLHADDLLKGHMNLLVKRCLKKGISLFTALRSVSLVPALHYQLPIGLLRVGDPADFLLVNDLNELAISETWIDGEKVYEGGSRPYVGSNASIINNFNSGPVSENDLELQPKKTYARIIEVEEGSIATKTLVKRIGKDWNLFLKNNQISYLFVKDRYTGRFLGKALVSGFGNMEGAIASTIAHDSHNIIALGNSLKYVVEAMNLVIGKKGGIAFVSSQQRELLSLPVAGLMSEASAEDVSEKYQKIIQLAVEHGCVLKSPLMTLSFLALLVIPELKVSDQGLFDVKTFNFTELFFD
jgi:adenine deaminase